MTLQGFPHTPRDRLEKQQAVQEMDPDWTACSSRRRADKGEVWGGHSILAVILARLEVLDRRLGGRDARGLDACLGRARSPAFAAVP